MNILHQLVFGHGHITDSHAKAEDLKCDKKLMSRSLRMGLCSGILSKHRRHRTTFYLPLMMIHNKALYSFCHAKTGGFKVIEKI